MRNNNNGVAHATLPEYFNFQGGPHTPRSPHRRSIGKTEFSEEKRTVRKKMPRVEIPNDPRPYKQSELPPKQTKHKQEVYRQPSFGMIQPPSNLPKERFRTEADQYFIAPKPTTTASPVTPMKKNLPPKPPQIFNPEHTSPRQIPADTKIRLPEIAENQTPKNIKLTQTETLEKQTVHFIPQVFPQMKAQRHSPTQQPLKNMGLIQPLGHINMPLEHPPQQTPQISTQQVYFNTQQPVQQPIQHPIQYPMPQPAQQLPQGTHPKAYQVQPIIIQEERVGNQYQNIPQQQITMPRKLLLRKEPQVPHIQSQHITPTQKSVRIQSRPAQVYTQSSKKQNRTNYIMNSKMVQDYRPNEEMVSSSGSRYELKLLSNLSSQRKSSRSLSLNSRISTIKERKSKKADKDKADEIIEKVQIHLEIMGCFAENADWIDEYYQGDAEWNLVKFFSYNRYYVERERVHNSLSKANQSCFVMRDLEVTKTDLKQIYRSPQIRELCESIEKQNVKIKAVLQQYFNNLDEKPYPRITINKLNSKQLIEESDRQLQGLLSLIDNKKLSSQERLIYEGRIIDIMKLVFLIQELDGVFVKSYTDSIDVVDFDKYLRENKWLYDRVLDNRC